MTGAKVDALAMAVDCLEFESNISSCSLRCHPASGSILEYTQCQPDHRMVINQVMPTARRHFRFWVVVSRVLQYSTSTSRVGACLHSVLDVKTGRAGRLHHMRVLSMTLFCPHLVS